MFGNPVRGRIRPPGSPVIVGSFRVTSTFEEHVASGRGEGTDIGNGTCTAPIFAIADGNVTLSGKIGLAKVVRIDHPQFPGHESGYAHLASIARTVKVGAFVNRGDRIGMMGRTGADECHFTLSLKLNGTEIPIGRFSSRTWRLEMLGHPCPTHRQPQEEDHWRRHAPSAQPGDG